MSPPRINRSRKPRIIPLVGRGTTAYDQVRSASEKIQYGTILAVDPSCGSRSSMPAYAVLEAGEIVDSGVIQLDVDDALEVRLGHLYMTIANLVKTHGVDVLVYEEIAARPFGARRFANHAHASLLKSVGVVLAAGLGVRHYVGLRPSVWKKLASPTYRKGDEEDAREMGLISVRIAQSLVVPVQPGEGVVDE